MTSLRGRTATLLSQRLRFILLVAGLTAAVLTLFMGGGTAVEQQLRVIRDAIRAHPASGEVHIVEIDKRSIDAIAVWPWPRSHHARAIDRLREAGAKSIAFDVDFSSFSNPADDLALAQSLERAGGNVVLPTMRQHGGGANGHTIDSEPIPALRAHAFTGAVSIRTDADGYIRSAPLGLFINGAPRPSLAAMVAETTAPAGPEFTIDYAIQPASVPRHSFIDLIEGRIPTAALRGKRIIIGATAAEIPDRYAVPGHGVIFGVVIQALAAETLMRGIPGDAGWLPALGLAFAAILLLGSRARRTVRYAGFAAAMLLVLGLPLALESWARSTASVVPALAALLAAGGLAAALSLAGKFRARVMTNAETGLPNVNALAEAEGALASTAVAVARIEEFSATASALGPEITADLVRRAAERISAAARTGTVYRIDEATLGWILEDGALDDIGDRFAALARAMRTPIEAGGRRIDVGMTFGAASGEGYAVRNLVANASLAAANAAKAGLRWQMFSAEGDEDAHWRLSLLGELDQALAAGDIWVAHQAKFDIAARRVIGSEALVRWQHPIRGPIPPDLFIPAVEANGRIGELTMHVLKTGLADAARWVEAGEPLGVAVNISVTLLAQPGFVEEIQAAIEHSGLPATVLTLEVTESAAMTSSDEAIATLQRLRDLGIKLSVDDYGTGQSTLTYLKRLPATELKIDKSFVQSIVADRSDAILVRSTIDLAHELGLKVVGEGVEDAECLEALATLGCDIAQGYHIGRPVAAADFLALARRHNRTPDRAAA